MPGPGLADQQELLRWADSLGSRSDLPRLIRKLILETGEGVVQLGFPAGEGIATGGWDGTARAMNSTAFVPDGLSLWELSVEKSVGKKADADYAKRTATPDGSPTVDCAYVAVSLRRFAKRGEWARTRTKDGRWREVRAYGVDDLETWLETAPVTRAWLSELLGLGPYGLRAGESWWNDWASTTDPTLTPDVVLAGRQSAADTLKQRLDGTPAVTTLQAGSLEEAQAFIAALAVRASGKGEGQLLARLAFVDDIATWRALRDNPQPLVLLPASDDLTSELSMTLNHHVVVPILSTATADVTLPPIDATEAQRALQDAGIDDERQADRSARLARRSILALRRHLAVKPELHTPYWAKPPGDRLIRGVLLAGRWIGRSEGDLAVLNDLLGKNDDDLREALDGLAAEQDPLIARVDESWALVSPYDAWLQLRGQLGEAELKRFESAVRSVLLEADPALELTADERWRAAVQGKVRKHSAALRWGLATSLALLGVNGSEIDNGRGSSFATYLVRATLKAANEDATGKVWQSVADLLPLLAEAAPGAFADAVRAGLKGDDPVLSRMFTDAKDGDPLFGSSSPHTGLLWALENLAWSDDHFGQAVDLLARLEEVDPGGQLANRPSNSLAGIFCPWHPETSATSAERLTVIDGLRKRHPDVAWPLMQSTLPEFHGVHSPTHEPEFRDWKPPRKPVTNVEYFEFAEQVARRMVEDAGKAGERWAALLDAGSNLPTVWQIVRDGLENQVSDLPAAEQEVLWNQLRAFITRHREFADADWALPEDELKKLDKLEQSIAPDDAAATHEWLFAEHMPDLGSGGKRDYAQYQEELSARRKDAVATVETEHGFDCVLALAVDSEVPGAVGFSLAEATGGSHEDAVLKLLSSDKSFEVSFAVGFFSKRFRQDGWDWLNKLLDKESDLPTESQGQLLVHTDDYPKAWEVAEARGAQIERGFWRKFIPLGLGPDFPHVQITAEKLLAADRPAAALRVVEIYLRHELEKETGTYAPVMADALDALLALQVSDPEFKGLSQYDFQRAFQYLERHTATLGVDRVARLEWAYLPALGLEPDTQALQEQLSESPEFFVQVVSAVYKPHSEKDRPPPTPHEETVARNGYRLLSSWKRVPGGGADGQIDGDRLRAWVAAAIEQLTNADRLEVGEIQIGHVLSHSPADPDGSWPCEPVRELLEELQSERVEEGLATQIFNNRGTTMRSPEAGGDQERELAAKFRESATSFAGQWPRIASVLRGLAESYESDARRIDSEAEHRRRGLD